jgi:putative ABC transport system permease protein
MDIILTALEQALIMLPLVLGVYLSSRILNVTDLTVDGTYVLGAALFASSIHFGLGVVLSMLVTIVGGGAIGAIVSLMQRNNIVSSLVIGILASFMLYSINLQCMGRPNISVLDMPNFLSILNQDNWIIPLCLIGLVVIIGLIILLNSRVGLVLRSFGHNQRLLNILGKNPEHYRLLGLIISNALAALSGSLSAQVNGFADINMGFGVALVSIGAILIGRHIVIDHRENFNVPKEMASCFTGIFLYFTCLSVLLRAGINPVNLKLALGAVLFISLRKIHRGLQI